MNIVIVGNGPSLIGSNLGLKIDEHPHILRFNNYLTEGYENDVGKRTTIWSKWYGLDVVRPTRDLSAIWINMPTQDRTEERIAKAHEIIEPVNCKLLIIPDYQIAEELHSKLYEGREGEFWPSSGILAIAHALCEGYQVSIAGIDSWASKPYHYYENHDRSNSHHIRGIEASYIATLVTEGKVKRL